MQKKVLRLIDVNYNRSLEGLRVCEDITRFILDDENLTSRLKYIRHRVAETKKSFPSNSSQIVKYRNIKGDVGKKTNSSEMKRKNFQDIFFVNLARVKESLRVLEEFAKLKHATVSGEFKKIRYLVYALEKKSLTKF